MKIHEAKKLGFYLLIQKIILRGSHQDRCGGLSILETPLRKILSEIPTPKKRTNWGLLRISRLYPLEPFQISSAAPFRPVRIPGGPSIRWRQRERRRAPAVKRSRMAPSPHVTKRSPSRGRKREEREKRMLPGQWKKRRGFATAARPRPPLRYRG